MTEVNSNQPHIPTEPAILVPKSSLTHLMNQINSLATSVAKSQSQNSISKPRNTCSTSLGKESSVPASKSSALSGAPHNKSHHSTSLNSHSNSQIQKKDIEDLVKSLPKYSGSVSESFNWWCCQVESFVKTFNLKFYDIEYYIPKLLLSGKALELYKSVQRENESSKSKDSDQSQSSASYSNSQSKSSRFKPLHWYVIKKELRKLDNPVTRTLKIHQKIDSLRATLYPKVDSSIRGNIIDAQAIYILIQKFRSLESQLDMPAPLPDRLLLLFKVLPECKRIVLDKINSIYEDSCTIPFSNIDEVCDFILIYKDEIVEEIKKLYSISESNSKGKKNNYNGVTSSTHTPKKSNDPTKPRVHHQNTGNSKNHGEIKETKEEQVLASRAQNIIVSSSSEDDEDEDDHSQSLESQSAPNSADSAATTTCHYCGRPGHKSNKCFKKKKDRQRDQLKIFHSLQENGLAVGDVNITINDESDI